MALDVTAAIRRFFADSWVVAIPALYELAALQERTHSVDRVQGFDVRPHLNRRGRLAAKLNSEPPRICQKRLFGWVGGSDVCG